MLHRETASGCWCSNLCEANYNLVHFTVIEARGVDSRSCEVLLHAVERLLSSVSATSYTVARERILALQVRPKAI